ncbi:DoxX family protein [Sphingomonas profundi]|uniref:DoxX family protein n=1 Tax=Alterirhizorhabdus profundi TaxID=2681549 RepID=UPI0012E70B80|nr:DoxX family protein [Sphingomonas profundi]
MAEARRLERARTALRWLLAAAFFFVGIAHIRSPGGFLAITPPWVPWPREVIFATGVCEIAGALALLNRRLRRIAGIMLAAYAVCVFPANIRHAVEHIAIGGTRLGWWYHGPRLAFQPVIVWWALFAGGVMDWPFGRRRRSA